MEIASTDSGCCAFTVVGGLLGALAGGYLGYLQWASAIDDAQRQGLTADYLPVGVVAFAGLAGLMGAIVARLVLSFWQSSPTLWPSDARRRD